MISNPQTIGICGLGQIGLPLGLTCWRSGFRVLLHDREHAKVTRAEEQLGTMDELLKRELPERKPNYGELELARDLATLDQEADLVLESVWEDLNAKVSLFQSLSHAAARGAVFCTCTSGLSITRMATLAGCPQQLVGTHFWSPPHLMPLVEIVKGANTTEEAIDIATSFCKRVGKRPVRVNIDAPGFIGNRMLHALWREAIDIVERGITSAEDVDTVAKLTFGLRQVVLGPLEHMDLAGLDLIRRIHEYLLPDLAANKAPGRLLQELVDQGSLGMKTGRGFYDWTRRDPLALVEARDRQVVRELKRLDRESQLAGASSTEEKRIG